MREYTPQELDSLTYSVNKLKCCYELDGPTQNHLKILIAAQVDPVAYAKYAQEISNKYYDRIRESNERSRLAAVEYFKKQEREEANRWWNRFKQYIRNFFFRTIT